MKNLTIISDNGTSFFSDKTRIYEIFRTKYFYNGSLQVYIDKKDILNTVEELLAHILQEIDNISKKTANNFNNSTRLKSVKYNNQIFSLNIKYEDDLMAYSLIELYNSIKHSNNLKILLHWGNTEDEN